MREGARFARNCRPVNLLMIPTMPSPVLVLFDIDGTLLSAGRVARESILVALERAYGWTIEPEHWDRSRHDFSGKTDPQIVRELVSESVGRQRCEEELERALGLYLEELERRLEPGTVVTKPGIPQLLARLEAEPRVTLGLLTGNLERGARIKLADPGLNDYFPFGAFGSDSADRYELPELAVLRAGSHGQDVFREERRDRRRLGARRRLRPVRGRARRGCRDRADEDRGARSRAPGRSPAGLLGCRPCLRGDHGMRPIVAAAAFLSAAVAAAGSGPTPGPSGAPSSIDIRVDTRAAREILLTLARPKWEPTDARLLEDIRAIELSIHDSGRTTEVFERDLKAAFETETRVSVFDFRAVREGITRWQALVSGLASKEGELAKMAASRAAALLPTDLPARARLEVHLSFGLAGLADNMVARAPEGGEIMVIDLARALGDSEGEPFDSRTARLARLIAGAAFRQAWASYRADSPAWMKPEPELGRFAPFARVIAEAGPVALFAVDESFFPISTWLKDLQKKAFSELERAAQRVADSETELEMRVEVMGELKRPDFARRVAGPAGMCMADGIRVALGQDAMKAALAGGPQAFFAAYDRATQKNRDLPPSRSSFGKRSSAPSLRQNREPGSSAPDRRDRCFDEELDRGPLPLLG